MSKMQSHNHEQNQRSWKQPMSKPSPSSAGKVGITAPQGKPSPTAHKDVGITSPYPGGGKSMSSKKRVRQAEEAVSPDTNTSNGGM